MGSNYSWTEIKKSYKGREKKGKIGINLQINWVGYSGKLIPSIEPFEPNLESINPFGENYCFN